MDDRAFGREFMAHAPQRVREVKTRAESLETRGAGRGMVLPGARASRAERGQSHASVISPTVRVAAGMVPRAGLAGAPEARSRAMD